MLNLIKTKRLVREQLQGFRENILSSKVSLPADITKFVFLCGANKIKSSEISARRKALIDFAKASIPSAQFFLAENMMETLRKEGHKQNILDTEHEISQFADYVVIILESPSTFAELGAFCHRELRSKLIIINDSRHASSHSFINLGPLQAISESSGGKNIITYKMSDEGINETDAIGDVYKPIAEILNAPTNKRNIPVNLDSCNPHIFEGKTSVVFVHDLIYFTGPILHKELIVILLSMFGKHDFKLVSHLALLQSFGSVTRNSKGLYKSTLGKTFLQYKFDTSILLSTFRNLILKHDRSRIYGY